MKTIEWDLEPSCAICEYDLEYCKSLNLHPCQPIIAGVYYINKRGYFVRKSYLETEDTSVMN